MRGRRRQIQTTTNTTPAATFPQAAAMVYSASLQSFLPPSAHAATSSSQHRPNRARPFQCAAVSAPSYSAASPSASAVPAERVEQRCNGRAGTGCSRRSTAPASQAHQAAHGADADKLTKEDVDVRLGLFHRRKQQCMPLLCQGIRDALKVRSLMNELTAAKTELKQSREVISNSKKALLDNALSQLDAFKNLSNPAINSSGNRGGAGNTSSNRGESGRDLRRRASTERKTLCLEERLSRANAAMKTLGQSGEEDPAPRRRPKLSAATAAKADQIKDLVVDLLLLGTIQREVMKRKNFRSNPAAQVGEGTPMAAAQLGGDARRLRGGPARLLRDDASRLLHRRLGLATRGDSLWVLRRMGEEDGGWWPELATRERRWRSEEGDGGVFSNDSKV
ncbi:hypothetical protein VPH35_104152 [Triticum aestivum]|uniref:uncharacterized protein n=1 Tax=Triticum aestivum TaxID=4565 RepID=UPI001D01A866|nr:uncharacterized protein LOC123132561 [Triticum aestivum]